MLEDALDRYIASKVAVNHRVLGGRILRTALEPSRSFAGLFMGKLPWQWPTPEAHLVKPTKAPSVSAEEDAPWKTATKRRHSLCECKSAGNTQ